MEAGLNKAEEEKYLNIIRNMEEEILTLKNHFNTHEDVKQELEDLLRTS